MILRVYFTLFALIHGIIANVPTRLGKYVIDPDSVTVGGFSSGGTMAIQYHITHSNTTKGSAIFEGVVYHCGSYHLLTIRLCRSYPSLINLDELVEHVKRSSDNGSIAPVSDLMGDKVFVWQGEKDTIVLPGNAEVIKSFYSAFGVEVRTIYHPKAAHCQPSDSFGTPCGIQGGLFICNCNFSGAYESLNYLYSENLIRPNANIELKGLFQEFDQREFFPWSTPSSDSMDDIGFIYLPSACLDKSTKCSLHVFFHGCTLGRVFHSDIIARNAGYLEVAEVNNIVVLFPQATTAKINPIGCWDWIGYTGYSTYDTNEGIQIAGIKKMVDRLISGEGTEFYE